MRRIFGRSKKKKKPAKEKAPKPSMGEISGKTDARITQLEAKIADCDKKLIPLKKKIKRSKGAAANRYKKQAMMILKRRKMFEKQLDQVSAMSLNTLSIVDTMENMKATQEMANAMKDTVKELKAAQKQFNIADFEDVYDDMDDLMMDQEEIQDIMSRQLGDMDDIDEDDLEAELEGLDDELEELDDVSEVPSYIEETPTDLPSAPTGTVDPVPAAPAGDLDEFGLPAVPAAVANSTR